MRRNSSLITLFYGVLGKSCYISSLNTQVPLRSLGILDGGGRILHLTSVLRFFFSHNFASFSYISSKSKSSIKLIQPIFSNWNLPLTKITEVRVTIILLNLHDNHNQLTIGFIVQPYIILFLTQPMLIVTPRTSYYSIDISYY